MAIPVLIMGKSGSGKSASLRKAEGNWLVINVNKKPLPFKSKDNIKLFNCDDYQLIKATLSKSIENNYKSVVIDVITCHFDRKTIFTFRLNELKLKFNGLRLNKEYSLEELGL